MKELNGDEDVDDEVNVEGEVGGVLDADDMLDTR